MKKYRHIKQPHQLEQKIHKILEEIHELEDPEIITEYKKFFKDNVSIFHRNYVAAYILKKFVDANNQKFSPSFTRDQGKNKLAQSDGDTTVQRAKKVSIKNFSRTQTTAEELQTFLCSFEDINEKDIYQITLYEKKIVLSINPSIFRPLLNNLRKYRFKGKKIFLSY